MVEQALNEQLMRPKTFCTAVPNNEHAQSHQAMDQPSSERCSFKERLMKNT